MPKVYPNIQSHTRNPGNAGLALRSALDGNDFRPYFSFSRLGVNAGGIKIVPEPTFAGDSIVRIPVRRLSGSGEATGSTFLIRRDSWVISPALSGINFGTLEGGIVDGSILSASTDYYVFAFMDPWDNSNDIFKGYGLVRRPAVGGGTMTAGGNLAGAGTLNIPGNANRFSVGARVLLRRGVTTADAYNQGTIISKTADDLELALDAAYTVGANVNSALTGATSTNIQVIQLNKPEPLIQASGAAYGGYAYCYMGLIQTDGSANIRYARKPGEMYEFSARSLAYSTTTNNSTVTVGLGRWAALGAEFVAIEATVSEPTGGGNPTCQSIVARNAIGGFQALTDRLTTQAKESSFVSDIIGCDPRFSSVIFRLQTTGAPSTTATLSVMGYLPGSDF